MHDQGCTLDSLRLQKLKHRLVKMPGKRKFWRENQWANNLNEADRFLEYLTEEHLGTSFSKDELQRIYSQKYKPWRKAEDADFEGKPFGQIRRDLVIMCKLVELGTKYIVNPTAEQLEEEIAEADESVDDILQMREERKKSNPHFCVVCGTDCQSESSYTRHVTGIRHRKQQVFVEVRRRKSKLIQCPEHLQIVSTPPANHAGVIEEVSRPNKPVLMKLSFRNDSPDKVLVVQNYVFLWETEVFTLYEDTAYNKRPKAGTHIQPGSRYNLKVICAAPKDFGHTFVLVAFYFKWDSEDVATDPFFVIRFLSVHVVNDMYDDIKPVAPFRFPTPFKTTDVKETFEAAPLPEKKKGGSGSLPKCPVPGKLRLQADRGLAGGTKIVDKTLREVLDCELAPKNHSSKFENLLWCEEIQMEKDILRYDLHGVTMERDARTGCLELEVPGLAERRPSLLRGDQVFIYRTGDHRSAKYIGRVVRIDRDGVQLSVHERLKQLWVRNMRFDVRFDFSRLSLWNEHRAVKNSLPLAAIVFPGKDTLLSTHQSSVTLRPWFDRMLNEEQRRAVTNVVHGTSTPAPYLIFGPPGTGKTVTMTEAIRQVYHCTKDTHMLVSAPENTAADLLVKKLVSQSLPGPVLQADIFRMYAISRSTADIPQEIRGSCNLDDSGDFYIPDKQELKKYRIIVVTLMNSGRLVSCSFPKNYFSHIFIDEAGHAKEPECLIPVTGLVDAVNCSDCQIVLAGDPKQLGAILRSPFALNFGLECSFLERLMDTNDLYERKDHGYNPLLLTKLINNYRSHDDIISVPRDLFYDGELIAAGNEMILKRMVGWEYLPNPEVPVIFHQVYGTDEREESSPSFFNRDEVAQVDEYLQLLLAEKKGGRKIKPKDIGVISPYRRQVLKIRQCIQSRKRTYDPNREIMVGSVEEFQGQERLVIIISTVRSVNQQYLDIDLQFHLGFLRNPKRFNVAITRARSLLIIIGNPLMLEQDDNWRRLLKYLHGKKCWKGRRPPVEKIGHLKNQGMEGEEILCDNESNVSYKQDIEEPPWERRD